MLKSIVLNFQNKKKKEEKIEKCVIKNNDKKDKRYKVELKSTQIIFSCSYI